MRSLRRKPPLKEKPSTRACLHATRRVRGRAVDAADLNVAWRSALHSITPGWAQTAVVSAALNSVWTRLVLVPEGEDRPQKRRRRVGSGRRRPGEKRS